MTYPFRDKTPVRRPKRKPCKHYNSYKKTLKADFNSRCGYCGCFDQIKSRSFTIDHFIPQNPEGWKHGLSSTDYYNLVYSCAYCNAAKTNKWPTKDINLSHNGSEGFIDPVDPDYDKLFVRRQNGEIKVLDPTNKLAVYIYTELNLKRTTHSILWKLERISTALEALKAKIGSLNNNNLDPLVNELLSGYYQLSTDFHSNAT